MFKKIRTVAVLSSFALVCALSLSIPALAQIRPLVDDGSGGRSCPSGSDGICRTKTDGGVTRKICVDLVAGEIADCNK